MFFLLTLPFRIAFGLLCGLLFLPFALLFLPFMLLRLLIKSVVLLVALPFVLLAVGGALLAAFVAVLFAVMIPLLPFAFLALFIWAIIRLTSRPSLSY
ncbi:MAG TPA: hypothetical protein VFI56_01085 [Vicinamibacterales bacterium]|jgi:hypothetical protein|nr:hypothetical protein [Vicinamibacterales bacterium]